MNQESSNIKCPNCGTAINVNDVLYHQLQSQAEKDFEKKNAQIIREKRELDQMRTELQQSIQIGVTEKLARERAVLEKSIREQITEEKSGELESLQEQLKEKIGEAKELNRIKAELLKLSREKEELRDKIQLESEEKYNKQLEEARQRLLQETESRSNLKIAEKENVIQQLKKQLTEAQQKADQGSMQLQGEVAELELEKDLRNRYPDDDITEVSKGANGADLLIGVRTPQQRKAGTIAIEIKRTKNFSSGWIPKLKEDQRNHKAEIAVLVTESMPADMPHFGLRDGVWVCSFREVQALLFVLRDSLLRYHEIKSAGENKTDKMSNLYDYLTGPEFSLQIRTIVESFTRLKTNLDQEKKAMMRLWKEREKTIELVGQCTSEMFGSFRAIAGSSVKGIDALNLPLLEEQTKNDE
ncbi:MAG TPA: DUF2130 domain-containing protein [Bacteroidia bacterium]|nr:DUF2130 domain-containing protein [Bacteroidia bacterium]